MKVEQELFLSQPHDWAHHAANAEHWWDCTCVEHLRTYSLSGKCDYEGYGEPLWS